MTDMKMAFEKAKEEAKKRGNGEISHIRVPKIKKISVPNQAEIDKAITITREYMAVIYDHMFDIVSFARHIAAASAEERDLCVKEFSELKGEISSHLNLEEKKPDRQTGISISVKESLVLIAKQAYALALASTLPPDKAAILEAVNGGGNLPLPGLIELKVLSPLESTDAGALTVKIYGKKFCVLIEKQDFAEKLGKVFAEKIRHEVKSRCLAMEAKATISVDQLLDGDHGVAFLRVLDENDKNGKFFPGGSLLLGSDGKKIVILEDAGGFERKMEEIRKAKIYLLLESVKSGKIFISPDLPENLRRNLSIFCAVVRRGIKAKKAADEKPDA